MWWWGARVFAGRFNWLGRFSHVAAVLVCLVSVLYLTLFPVYWEYGEMNYSGEGRTYNVSYMVLCAIVLTIAGAVVRALGGPLSGAETTSDVRRGWVELTVAGVLAGLLIASPSTRHTYETLKTAPAYLKEEQARARALRRAPSEGVVFVDRITVRPAGLFWGDLEPDEAHWINVCYAKYYRLQSVRSRS